MPTTWRSYRDPRLLWRHFTLSMQAWFPLPAISSTASLCG